MLFLHDDPVEPKSKVGHSVYSFCLMIRNCRICIMTCLNLHILKFRALINACYLMLLIQNLNNTVDVVHNVS